MTGLVKPPSAKTTQLVMVVVILVTFGYDFWALQAGGYQSTISFQSYSIASQYPIVTFLLGVVAGHLWWPQYREDFAVDSKEK